LLRVLLRNQKAAIAAWIIVLALMSGSGNLWIFAIQLVSFALLSFMLMRFGLVAAFFELFSIYLFETFPVTLDASAWYAGTAYAALAILAVVILYAFCTSLGGRPLLAPSHLDD